ncbi:MAG: transglycosylase domain-containing protein, partial [Pseudolabrys sp.]
AKDRAARPPLERDERSPAKEKTPRRGRAKSENKEPAKRKRGSSKVRFTWRRTIYWLFVLTLWLVIAAIGTLIWVGMHLPPLQSLDIPKRPPSIQILGLDQKPLAIRGEGNSSSVTLKEMPAYLPKAFIAIEDRRFYQHHGVDPFGLLRATVANVLHRGVSQGGSTLTQQLAKNLFLTHERTFSRKLQEAVLALWLEHKFGKDQILELYLNRVYFGAGAYGIEQASQRYFGKSARTITLAEAAMLAGVVKSPSRLAPTRNFNGAERRAKSVLAAMADLNFINHTTERMALARPPRIVAQVSNGAVNYVADWVMDALNDAIGHVDEDIVIQTTIDANLQTVAEKTLEDELAQKGDKNGVGQGAVIAMTPDGAVRAMVGGRNYADSQFNRAVAAKRQPGSAFKAFVYLTALEHGLTPDTVREDKPINVKGWQPENYNHEYFGPVTLSRALAQSLNTVSVRLTLELTPMAVVRTAYRLGIGSKLEPNVSIALGTSEVSMLELVGAYASFANGGYALMPRVIDKII